MLAFSDGRSVWAEVKEFSESYDDAIRDQEEYGIRTNLSEAPVDVSLRSYFCHSLGCGYALPSLIPRRFTPITATLARAPYSRIFTTNNNCTSIMRKSVDTTANKQVSRFFYRPINTVLSQHNVCTV